MPSFDFPIGKERESLGHGHMRHEIVSELHARIEVHSLSGLLTRET